MVRFSCFLVVLVLFSCTSKQDKLAAELAVIDIYLHPKPMLEKIPDSLALKMHDFAVAYPANPKSEEYLYRSTQIAERTGRFFETAKWCEDYTIHYPKGKNVFEAIAAAGANYEKIGNTGKAIQYYTRLYTEFPKSEFAASAKKNVEMLKMGLVTPEKQLEYLIKNNPDSVKNK